MKTAAIIIPAALLLAMIGCAEPLVTADAKTRFEKKLGDTTIRVYPTFVRTAAGVSYDDQSAAEIAKFFARNSMANCELVPNRIDLSAATGRYQYDLCRDGLKLFSDHVRTVPPGLDYALVAEYLITATRDGGQAVGGINFYVVDSTGEPAYVLMLNSHNEAFARLKPQTIADATAVLLEVLDEKLKETHLNN